MTRRRPKWWAMPFRCCCGKEHERLDDVRGCVYAHWAARQKPKIELPCAIPGCNHTFWSSSARGLANAIRNHMPYVHGVAWTKAECEAMVARWKAHSVRGVTQ